MEAKMSFQEFIHLIGHAQHVWTDHHAMNTITMCAHLEYNEWFIGTISTEPSNYIISDSGADTYVIGSHGWRILDTDPHGTANLVAFDPNKMHKPKYPTVTATTKVRMKGS